MTKVAMCDVCTDVINHSSKFNRVIDGEGKLLFDTKDRTYDVNFQFINPATGDRIDIDLCPVCLAKGGIGQGGKEKSDGQNGTNHDRHVLQDD